MRQLFGVDGQAFTGFSLVQITETNNWEILNGSLYGQAPNCVQLAKAYPNCYGIKQLR